jgi:hypothetical protein
MNTWSYISISTYWTEEHILIVTSSCSRLPADSPVDGGDTWNVVLRADPFSQESISDLPCEHGGVLTLVVGNCVHYERSRYFGLASADDSRLETARLVISASPKQSENGFTLNLV